MQEDEKQKFQSDAQLTALKVHAAWMKVENFLTFPFRWLLDQFNHTDAYGMPDAPVSRPSLKVVK